MVMSATNEDRDKVPNDVVESASTESDFAITPENNELEEDGNICRICMCRGVDKLISPCNCRGSLAYVHRVCLQRWLDQVGRNYCELCEAKFNAVSTPRYSILDAFEFWFCDPHITYFICMTALIACALAICNAFVQYIIAETSRYGVTFPLTQFACEFGLLITFCMYVRVAYKFWKNYYQLWLKWKNNNLQVTLLLSECNISKAS